MRIKAGTCWSVRAAVRWSALWQASGGARRSGEPAFGCGHVHTAEAQRNPYGPNDGPPPIAIGDSTMLLPIPDLTRVGLRRQRQGLPRLQAERLGRARPAQPGQAPEADPDQRLRQRRRQRRPDQVRPQGDRTEADAGPGHRLRRRHRRSRPRPTPTCSSRPPRTTRTRSSCSTGSSTRLPHHKVEPAPGRLVPARPLPSELHRRPRLRELPRPGAARRPAERGRGGSDRRRWHTMVALRRSAGRAILLGWRSFSSGGVFQATRDRAEDPLDSSRSPSWSRCSPARRARARRAAAPGTTPRPRSSRTPSRSRCTCAR